MSTISGVSSSGDPWAAMKAQRSQMQTRMFSKVDTDGSGGIDKAELQTMLSDISQKTGVSISADAAKTFSQIDSNADGSLSSDELAQGMQSLMPPPSTMEFAQSRNGDIMGGSGGSQDDLFSKIDTNSDGSIDATELKGFTDKIKSDTGKDASDLFAKLDTDGDGKLTQTEFDAGRPQGGPSGPPPAGGASKVEPTSTKTYDKLDTNQDGTVSELERLVGAIKDAATASHSGASDSSQASDGEAKEKSNSFVDVAKLAQQMYAQIAASLSGQGTGTLRMTA